MQSQSGFSEAETSVSGIAECLLAISEDQNSWLFVETFLNTAFRILQMLSKEHKASAVELTNLHKVFEVDSIVIALNIALNQIHSTIR